MVIQTTLGYAQTTPNKTNDLCIYSADVEDQSCPINNPTFPATGTKAHYETHYQGTGKDALVWQWSYKNRYSGWQRQGQGQWMHNYARHLVALPNGPRELYAVRGSGAVHEYDTRNGPPWRSSDSANELVIQKNDSGQVTGYQLKVAEDDSIESYDAAGRQLTLSYNTQGDIASMTAPGGEITAYE